MTEDDTFAALQKSSYEILERDIGIHRNEYLSSKTITYKEWTAIRDGIFSKHGWSWDEYRDIRVIRR